MRNPWPVLICFMLFCPIDIGKHIYEKLLDSNNTVGAFAHLFGGLAGLLFGFVVLKNLRVDKLERVIWWISISIYLIFMIIGLSVHVFCPDFFRITSGSDSINFLQYARSNLPTILDKIHVNNL
jgi:hypothetical protein